MKILKVLMLIASLLAIGCTAVFQGILLIFSALFNLCNPVERKLSVDV